MKWDALGEATFNGARSVHPALVILWLAWSLSKITDEKFLGTGDYVGSMLVGSVPTFLMPSNVFILASFVAFSTGNTNLGFNRPIHLALPAITLSFLPMPAGTASLPISIPNNATLSGLSLYLQAGVLNGATVHVTNSGQLTVR